MPEVNRNSPTHVNGGAINDSLAVADQVQKKVGEFVTTESMRKLLQDELNVRLFV